MIKAAILWALALLLAYSAVLLVPAVSKRSAVQGHVQENIVRYQDYATASPLPSTVIVGTSLSRRLAPPVEAGTCANLSLSGGNVLTGLDFVGSQPHLPEAVFVETTMITQLGGDEAVLANVNRPVFAMARRHIPALRERFQPANLAAFVLGNDLLRPALSATGLPLVAPGVSHKVVSRQAWQAARDRAVRERSTPFDPPKLDRLCAELRQKIESLQARGVRVTLMELPHDPQVMATTRYRQVSTAVRQALPEAQFAWLPPPRPHDFATTDGIHLTDEELEPIEKEIAHRITALRALPNGRLQASR